MTDYLLLSDLKAAVNTQSNTALTNDKLMEMIEAESRAIEQADLCNRRFDHRIETRYFNPLSLAQDGDRDGNDLLIDDIISVTEVVNGDGTEITGDQYLLLPMNRPNKSIISLKSTSGIGWTVGDQDPREAIVITGVYGYGGSWVNTGITVGADGITDSATSLPVSATTGLEKRMILRIDSEYLLIDAAVSASPVYVERAVNGSTAAAHSLGAAIYRFVPDSNVQTIIKRLCAWRLEQRKSPLFGTVQVGDFEQPTNISTLPNDLKPKVRALRRAPRIRGVQ